jgi:hypothetical protein
MGKAIPDLAREWRGVMHGSLVLSFGCKCLRKIFCIFLAHVFEIRMGISPLSTVKLRNYERGPEKLGQFLTQLLGRLPRLKRTNYAAEGIERCGIQCFGELQ